MISISSSGNFKILLSSIVGPLEWSLKSASGHAISSSGISSNAGKSSGLSFVGAL
jgi:hypothetical protein